MTAQKVHPEVSRACYASLRMIRFFTVEREYGSEGAEFAAALAAKLGWKLYDQELIEMVAKEAGVSPADIAATDERPDPWMSRWGRSFWQGSLEQGLAKSANDPDDLHGYLQNAMRRVAEEGHCVIVGRGGSSLLCGEVGAFHVFTYASMPRKKRWFEEKYPERASHAEHDIHAADAARAEYIRKHYGRDWADKHLYHLLLNSCMGLEAMVKAAIDAAGELG